VKLKDLRNKHAGETIWVIGSGHSLNFIDPTFFDNKITVTVNFVGSLHGFTPDYLFSHYHKIFRDDFDKNTIGVTLQRDTLSHQEWEGTLPSNLIFNPHGYDLTHGANFNPYIHTPDEDSLVYGSSSLHGAMHLAAYLGARFVILVGADCGTIDGHHNISDYPNEYSDEYLRSVWIIYNNHHELMKRWIKQTYGCDVYSLNPFINLNLEGHKFEGV